MNGTTRSFSHWVIGSEIVLAALIIFVILAPNLPGQGRAGQQQDGPTPRTADGHPDLTGRYVFTGGDPQRENPVFKPETKAKYQYAAPFCTPPGTPTSITIQASEHAPIQLISKPGVLWIVTEFPQAVRRFPTDGRPHSEDPDTTFAGESVGHWEGDTLVIDTVAIDTRMRNIGVGLAGDQNAWTHSEKEHVIEHFSRPTKNSLIYQVTVEDPIVLLKPFASAPMRWSLGVEDIWRLTMPRPGCDF